MHKLLVIFSLCFSSLFAQGPNQIWSQGMDGDIFISVSFVKANEDPNDYFLDQAIDKAKSYLSESYNRYGIHFFFNPTLKYHGAPNFIWQEWKNKHLPNFEEELTIYVFSAEDSLSGIHQYSFSGSNQGVALVPYYDQEEFNWFVAKNISYMLGLELKEELWAKSSRSSTDKEIEFTIIRNLSLESRTLFIVNTYPKESQDLERFKSKNSLFTLHPKQVTRVRKNLAIRPDLRHKLLRFQTAENGSLSPHESHGVITDM